MSNLSATLARETELFFETSPATFELVPKVTSLGYSGEMDEIDVTTNDGNGFKEKMAGLRSASFTISSLVEKDCDTGLQSSVQTALQNASVQFGCTSAVNFQLRAKSDGAIITEFKALVNITSKFGATGDAEAFEIALSVSGSISFGILPISIVAVPASLSLADDDMYANLLSAVFNPLATSDKGLLFSSDDTAVVKVSPEGRVFATGVGSANITVTSRADGAITATIPVTVA